MVGPVAPADENSQQSWSQAGDSQDYYPASLGESGGGSFASGSNRSGQQQRQQQQYHDNGSYHGSHQSNRSVQQQQQQHDNGSYRGSYHSRGSGQRSTASHDRSGRSRGSRDSRGSRASGEQAQEQGYNQYTTELAGSESGKGSQQSAGRSTTDDPFGTEDALDDEWEAQEEGGASQGGKESVTSSQRGPPSKQGSKDSQGSRRLEENQLLGDEPNHAPEPSDYQNIYATSLHDSFHSEDKGYQTEDSEESDYDSLGKPLLRDENSGGPMGSNNNEEEYEASQSQRGDHKSAGENSGGQNLKEGELTNEFDGSVLSEGGLSNISGFEDFEFTDEERLLHGNSGRAKTEDQEDNLEPIDENNDKGQNTGDDIDDSVDENQELQVDELDDELQERTQILQDSFGSGAVNELRSTYSGDHTSANDLAAARLEDQPFLQDEKGTEQPPRLDGKLPEQMFSFMISSGVTSKPFSAAFLLIIFKLWFLAMLVADLTTSSEATKANPLGIPASVKWTVATTQVLALSISALIQDDLIKGLSLLREGYYGKADFTLIQEGFQGGGIGEAFGGVSNGKWMFAIVWQTLAGLVSLGATFLLIIAAPSVSELLLTFAITSFVSQLDKASFLLAKNDFLGKKLRDEVRTILITTYHVPTLKKKSILPAIIIGVSMIGMVVGWVLVFLQQSSGAYLPQSVIAQFDDSNNVKLGYLSGRYDLESSPVRYINGKATIMFCSARSVWTLRVGGNDPCQNVLARSAEIRDTDLTSASHIDWFVLLDEDIEGRAVLMESFYLSPGCHSDADCGGANRGTCNGKNTCRCKTKYFGLRCDYEMDSVCPVVEIDDQTSPFRATRTLSSRYSVLRSDAGRIVQAYYRPVYASQRISGGLDIILYTGSRWVATSSDDLAGLVDRTTAGLSRYFQAKPFDALASLANVDQVSALARFKSKADMSSPIILPWFPSVTQLRTVEQTSSRLICRRCDTTANPCLNGGICSSGGTCTCAFGATGELCQVAPTGNGRCDPFFNSALYNFDGGDCCSSTCTSSLEFQCGQVARSVDATSFAGFPLCRDPEALGCDSSETCWSTNENSVSLLSSGQDSTLTLTSNGASLVLSEPSLDTIRVFDQVDDQWVLRGVALQSGGSNQLGRTIAVSSPPGTLVTKRVGKVPLVVAASVRSAAGVAVRVWDWESQAATWSQVCNDLLVECSDDDCEVSSLSVGREGNRGVLAVATNKGEVHVFEIFFGAQSCDLKWTSAGYAAQVSGNGERLVVGSSIRSAEFLVFDVSVSLSQPVGLDSNEDLVARSYGGPSVNQPLAQEPSSVFSHDGITLNIAAVGSDSLVTIDTLRMSKISSTYELLNTTNIGIPVATLSIDAPSVVFSSDGGSVGVKGTDDSIHLFRYDDSNSQELWRAPSTSFQVSTPDSDFGVASDGSLIAAMEDKAVDVARVSRPCRVDESLIRVSITLDDNPSLVSWYLDVVGVEDSALVFVDRTLAGCQGCYNQDLAGGVVLQDVCVPDRFVNCVRLTFKADQSLSSGAEITGFVDGVEFVVDGGEDAESEHFVAFNNAAVAADCSSTNQLLDETDICDKGDKKLVAFLTFDANPEEVEWSLESVSSGRELARGNDYDLSQAFATVAASTCVPSDSDCLMFIITDSRDDGVCCDYGFGDLELYLDGEKVYNPQDRFSSGRQEIYFGTGCPPTMGPTPAPLAPISTRPPLSLPTPAPVSSPTVDPTTRPTQSPTSESSDAFPSDVDPAPAPTVAPTPEIAVDPAPAPTINPASFIIPLPTFNAPIPNQLEITIVLQLDGAPQDVGWSLSRTSDDTVIASAEVGKYSTSSANTNEFTEFANIAINENYLFCITDNQGNGISDDGTYSISYEGWPLVLGDGDFEGETCNVFGVTEEELAEFSDTD